MIVSCNLSFNIYSIIMQLDDWGNAKIGDFGLAKIFSKSATVSKLTLGVGTFNYSAPEIFEGDDEEEGAPYDEKVDCWSFAILL